jgi:hypothetical protein
MHILASLTVRSTAGIGALPPSQPSLLELHIQTYPSKAGAAPTLVSEIELPIGALQLDPTAPNPAASLSRWTSPGTNGAAVVRYWVIEYVPSPIGVTRPVLVGPFSQ